MEERRASPLGISSPSILSILSKDNIEGEEVEERRASPLGISSLRDGGRRSESRATDTSGLEPRQPWRKGGASPLARAVGSRCFRVGGREFSWSCAVEERGASPLGLSSPRARSARRDGAHGAMGVVVVVGGGGGMCAHGGVGVGEEMPSPPRKRPPLLGNALPS